MENYTLASDIKVYCVAAKSFPEGVLAAHEQLHSLVPFSKDRIYFGVSHGGEGGKILYWAAATELAPGELSKHDLETFVAKKGNYHSIVIKNFMDDLASIGKAFDKILDQPDIDENGACIEWYFNEKDVRCMVRKSH